jgi:small-conductance mechanosensitive channel
MRFTILPQFRELLRNLGDTLPTILTAVGLVLAGWVLAVLLRSLSRRAAEGGLRRLGRGSVVRSALEGGGVHHAVSKVVGGFVFWAVLLLFVAAALERLGLPVLSTLVSELTFYLPNVFAAVLIVLGGVVLGTLAGGAVTAGASAAGIARGPDIGRAVQAGFILVAAVVGLEQVGIQGQLFVIIVAVVFATFLGGAGLAFGLGARTAVGNIIASHYVAQAYHAGQRVRIGDVEGRIVETTRTAVVIGTGEGRVLIPAQRFSEQPSVLLMEGSNAAT